MIVQCKHWSRKVAVDDMRAFFGVLKSHDLERGIFATSATFTADTAAFASANGISAQNRTGLLNLIAGRSPAQQAALLEVAYEGEYWRPTCANCGVKMVVRQPKDGGGLFWAVSTLAGSNAPPGFNCARQRPDRFRPWYGLFAHSMRRGINTT